MNPIPSDAIDAGDEPPPPFPSEAPDIPEQLRRLGPSAVEVVAQLMLSARHERIRLEAARLVLEFGGFKPTQRHEVALHHVEHARSVDAAWERRKARLETHNSVTLEAVGLPVSHYEAVPFNESGVSGSRC